MAEPKEYLHFGCCFCNKDLPEKKAKRVPRGFGLVCQDCSIKIRRLLRNQPKPLEATIIC